MHLEAVVSLVGSRKGDSHAEGHVEQGLVYCVQEPNLAHFINQFSWNLALPTVFGLGLLFCIKGKLGSYGKTGDHIAHKAKPFAASDDP